MDELSDVDMSMSRTMKWIAKTAGLRDERGHWGVLDEKYFTLYRMLKSSSSGASIAIVRRKTGKKVGFEKEVVVRRNPNLGDEDEVRVIERVGKDRIVGLMDERKCTAGMKGMEKRRSW